MVETLQQFLEQEKGVNADHNEETNQEMAIVFMSAMVVGMIAFNIFNIAAVTVRKEGFRDQMHGGITDQTANRERHQKRHEVLRKARVSTGNWNQCNANERGHRDDRNGGQGVNVLVLHRQFDGCLAGWGNVSTQKILDVHIGASWRINDQGVICI